MIIRTIRLFLKIGASLKHCLGLLSRGSGLIEGRFRADPYRNYSGCFQKLGGLFLFVGVLLKTALLFGLY